jgi:hypothetical protein
MNLSEEDKQQIKQYKAEQRKRKAYSKAILKERREYEEKILEINNEIIEERIQEKIKNELKPEDETTKAEPPKISKKLIRPYKSFYICQTCNNEFARLDQLRKHLLLIRGCSFLSDTTTHVDQLLTKNMEKLEVQLNSYKLDLEACDYDFTTKKKRINSMKKIAFTIETLFKNQCHLYEEPKRLILEEYINEYKNDIKMLLREYYKMIEKADLFDL